MYIYACVRVISFEFFLHKIEYIYMHVYMQRQAWRGRVYLPASVAVQRPSVVVQRQRAWELLGQQAWLRWQAWDVQSNTCRGASGSRGTRVIEVWRRDLRVVEGSNCLCKFLHITCMYLMCFKFYWIYCNLLFIFLHICMSLIFFQFCWIHSILCLK